MRGLMMPSKIIRNGFEITVKDNTSKWLRKADKIGALKSFMWNITTRVEEWGICWTYESVKEFTYPYVLNKEK